MQPIADETALIDPFSVDANLHSWASRRDSSEAFSAREDP